MKDYRTQLDALCFTAQQKQEMTDRLLAAAGTERPRRSHRRGVTAALIAAVLALSIGTAGATGALASAGALLASWFGGAPAQVETLDQMGQAVGATATADGIAVTVEAVVRDDRALALLCSVRRTDGQPLYDGPAGADGRLPLRFTTVQTDLPGVRDSYAEGTFRQGADGAVRYEETVLGTDAPLTGGEVRLTLAGLVSHHYAADGTTLVEEPIAAGPWTLTFPLDAASDAQRDLPAGQQVRVAGRDLVLDRVTISPLSLRVEGTVTVPGADVSTRFEEAVAGLEGGLPLTVTFTDGTTLAASGCARHGVETAPAADDGALTVREDWLFRSVRPLDEIASVTVGDVTIDLR